MTRKEIEEEAKAIEEARENREVTNLYELVDLFGKRFPEEDIYLNVSGELEETDKAKYPNLVIPSPIVDSWEAIDRLVIALVEVWYKSKGVNWWNKGKDKDGKSICLSTGEALEE